MSRIITVEKVSFDLENIKEIIVQHSHDEHSKVIIKLLKGKEYIESPYDQGFILMHPEIVLPTLRDSHASACRDEIVKQWEDYLIEKELNDLAREE